ncbi:MAG: hypothetical protein ABII00_06440 [Elusimicrobiota bacterium]
MNETDYEKPEGQAPPPRRRWWASFGFWMLLGAGLGTAFFAVSQRDALRRAYRAHLPEAKAVGKDMIEIAGDLGRKYAPEGGREEDLPPQPSASSLSAPVDPSAARRRSETSRRQRRSLPGRRRIGKTKYRSAAEVQDVRQRLDAPVIQHEFKVPFLQTDLGRGMTMSFGIACFFGLLGYLLFRNKNR